MRAGRHLALVTLLLASAGVAGCGGEDPRSGLTAYLRVANGQYEPGELTAADGGMTEPTVHTISTVNTHVFPGALSRSVRGTVDQTSVAVLIGLEGDTAHWLIPLSGRDIDTMVDWTFSASLSYSPELPLGPRSLRFRAIDASGNLGPIQSLNLKVDEPLPVGNLVIQLTWDTEADLDLHVRIMDPTVPKTGYFDVWNKQPLALPRQASGQPYSSAAIAAAGHLVFDSNSQCVIDGQRHEEVVFPGAVPAGPYEVRVDTFSLCGESTARWHVAAFTNPADPATPTAPLGAATLIQEAYGQSLDRDTVASHGAASGLLAFTFSPP